MLSFLYVFLGGGAGSAARYAIARGLSPYDSVFPWATLTANLLACVLLGALAAYSAKAGLPSPLRHALMVGFCGGFSTFSTFSNETFTLMGNGNYAYAAANILGSVLLCLLGIYLGMALVQGLLSD